MEWLKENKMWVIGGVVVLIMLWNWLGPVAA
jgi:uncharacterized membrane protein